MAEQKTTTERQRNKRKPFGVPRLKLSIDKQLEGYHYRWVNDEPGRIAQALSGDYAFAEPEEVGREDTDDGKVRELAGTNKDGSAMYAYLMRIPYEFYLEDQSDKQAYLDEVDKAIRGGKISTSPGDNRYVPEGGISIKTK
jgi:hypothetical protein